MKEGRKNKPASLHKQQGTYREDRHLPDAMENYVETKDEPPQAPEKLTENAKRYWFLVVRELIRNRVYSDGDSMLIEILCGKMDLHDRAIADLNNEGLVSIVTNSKGTTYPMPHPNINIARTLSKEILEITSHLGLSPLARTQIGVSKSDTKDPLKGLIKK